MTILDRWRSEQEDCSTDECSVCEKEIDEQVTVVVEDEKEKEYTEHRALAEFIDGDTQEFVFDSMEEYERRMVLKEYTDVQEPYFANGVKVTSSFEEQAFVTIPWANLKSFRTIDRTEKTLTVTREQEYQHPRSKAEGFVMDSDNAYILEDQEE